jgi:predicted NBD/HSP70 family sugar kinase
VDGRLFHAAAGISGEIGHLMLDEHGEVCRYGNHGCLELVAGGNALVVMLRRTPPGGSQPGRRDPARPRG